MGLQNEHNTEELLNVYVGLVGSLDYRIRGDMTYFTSPNDDRAVFCTGSIAYGQDLPVNNCNNSASSVFKNLLKGGYILKVSNIQQI